jgi:hypothetical protein
LQERPKWHNKHVKLLKHEGNGLASNQTDPWCMHRQELRSYARGRYAATVFACVLRLMRPTLSRTIISASFSCNIPAALISTRAPLQCKIAFSFSFSF